MSSRSSENEVWPRDVPFERLADEQELIPTGSNIPSQRSGKMLVIWPLAIVIWALATIHDENTYVEQGSALRFYPVGPRADEFWG